MSGGKLRWQFYTGELGYRGPFGPFEAGNEETARRIARARARASGLTFARLERLGVERCGRLMVGSGTDTYDPTCDLLAGHSGSCKSTAAIDQHRLPSESVRDGGQA